MNKILIVQLVLYSAKTDTGICFLDDSITHSPLKITHIIFAWQLYIEVSDFKIKAAIWAYFVKYKVM